MSSPANAYVSWVAAAGSVAIGAALSEWQFTHTLRFPLYFCLVVLTSMIKIRFPAITVTVSCNSLFVILAAAQLDSTEAMLIACGAAASQTLLNVRNRPNPIQLCFNIAVLGISTSACLWTVSVAKWCGAGGVIALCCSAVVFYALDTVLVSGIVALLRETTVRRVWQVWLRWTTPGFVVSTAAAVALFVGDPAFRWGPALSAIPAALIVMVGYRRLIAARLVTDI